MLVCLLVVTCPSLLPPLGVYNRLPVKLVTFVAILLGVAVVTNLVNRWLIPEADPVLLPVVLVLNGLGFVMMVRLAPFQAQAHLAGSQAVWSLLGIIVYTLTLLVVR